jgi:hypothetical protein
LAAGQPERLGLAVAALRSLLAVSHASKLRVLASGFLPTLLARVEDIRALCALPRPTNGGGLGTDPSSTEVKRSELLPSLLGTISVLSNLLAHCEEAKLACVSLQLPLLLLRLWPLGQSRNPTRGSEDEGRLTPPKEGTGAGAVRQQLLALLANYVAHCAAAKCSLAAYSDAKGRSLVALLAHSVSRTPRPTQTPPPLAQWNLSWAVLQSVATAPEGRAVLLRAQLAPKAAAALRRLVGGKGSDDARAAAVADFLANLAFEPDGAEAVVRAPEAFDTLVFALRCRHAGCRRAAALALRNLAFCADGKAALLAKKEALPALFGAIAADDAALAARAAGAVWALLAKCERAKVALRSSALLQQLHEAEMTLAARTVLRDAAEAPHVAQALSAVDAIYSLLGADR